MKYFEIYFFTEHLKKNKQRIFTLFDIIRNKAKKRNEKKRQESLSAFFFLSYILEFYDFMIWIWFKEHTNKTKTKDGHTHT